MTRRHFALAPAFALTVALTLTLTGCGSESEAEQPTTWVEVVPVPDGRQVTCIMWDPPTYAGAMSCDWQAAR